MPPFYATASNIFSMKIPYPVCGSFTKTWVTAPTSFPSWMMGERCERCRGQMKRAERVAAPAGHHNRRAGHGCVKDRTKYSSIFSNLSKLLKDIF